MSHGLAGIERGASRAGPIPEALLAAANRSARNGVGLDLVLRGYFAGYAVFCDFVLRAAEDEADLSSSSLRRVLRAEAALFERILVAVAEAYARERRGRPRPPAARQLECVKALLAGEPADAGELAYELADWHVGALAKGPGAAAGLRELARAADCRPLLVCPDPEVVWAWFGSRRRTPLAKLAAAASVDARSEAAIAFGEPARGMEGWRLTHRQAAAALRVARSGTGAVRYADVGLLASISEDRVLVSSLHQMFLAPLAEARDGGTGLRETLRAYFATGRNVSSAASALGVSRQTVSSRLRTVEEKLGRMLETCAPEVELALRLEALGEPERQPDAILP